MFLNNFNVLKSSSSDPKTTRCVEELEELLEFQRLKTFDAQMLVRAFHVPNAYGMATISMRIM